MRFKWSGPGSRGIPVAVPYEETTEMACMFICDGCQKHVAAVSTRLNGWAKPHNWYHRTDKKTSKIYDACSRLCIKRLEREKGICSVILPI